MREVTITFTIPEMVKLISCCNQAISSGYTTMCEHGNIHYHTKDFTLKDSMNYIVGIKKKLKETISNQFATNHGRYSVTLTLGEFIKLNACCNSAIDSQKKTLALISEESESLINYTESIQEIEQLKLKIKSNLPA